MNTIRFRGHWNVFKGKIKQRFARLAKNKSRYAHGREEELIGRLQRRLGKSRREVEQMIGSHHSRGPQYVGFRHD